MESPKCGSEKAVFISKALYNKGLKKIKERNITEGVKFLKKSLLFNKKNTRSRNLLALAYVEIGLIANAALELKLAVALDPSDLDAPRFLAECERRMEDYSEAVKVFNQSIVYLRQKSSDMAVIQLKKAAEIYSNFTELQNLLALAYVTIGKKDLALSVIAKVLRTDSGNEKALRYRTKILGFVGEPPVLEPKKTSDKKQNFTYSESAKHIKNSGLLKIFYGVVGLILSAAVFMLLIIPDIAKKDGVLIAEQRQKADDLEIKYNELKSANDSAALELAKTKETLELTQQQLATSVDLQDRIRVLDEAAAMVASADYLDAARRLKTINQEGLEEIYLNRYAELIQSSYTRAANSLYQQGITRYNARAYDLARALFSECISFAAEGTRQYGDALYFLGECSRQENDMATANEFYQRVVDEYRNISNYYWTAYNYLY
jgi:Tfp pilus assembly protein PilF